MRTQRGYDVPDLARSTQLVGLAIFWGLAGTTCLLAIPFLRNESFAWEDMNAPLLAGTVSLTLAVLCHACLTFSVRDAFVFFALSFSIGLFMECAGTSWGIPFGCRYDYHEDLRPQLAGGVPVFIPLAWFVLAYAPVVFLRRLNADPQAHANSRRWLLLKAGLCAVLLAATDLYLDPLAISVGAWNWADKGAYFGVPLQNYVGWFLVGFLIYAGFFLFRSSRAVGFGKDVRLLDGSFVILSLVMAAIAQISVLDRVDSHIPVVLSVTVIAPYIIYWLMPLRKHPLPESGNTET